jgi:hypothetical protein
MAQGQEADGKPSLRYITLLREGVRAHGLPEQYIRFLENVEHTGIALALHWGDTSAHRVAIRLSF